MAPWETNLETASEADITLLPYALLIKYVFLFEVRMVYNGLCNCQNAIPIVTERNGFERFRRG
jgi:hypothetical protein